ncbi:hypothetical protein BSKO_00260 [Bryopsis sp. KO-2023]|nr:hypothetical protein BSKO_00260 [Bryopsis sp. KO-2023]
MTRTNVPGGVGPGAEDHGGGGAQSGDTASTTFNVINVFISVFQRDATFDWGLGRRSQGGNDEERATHRESCETVSKFRHNFHTIFEGVFSRLGGAVAVRPWITILICCLVVGVCTTGLFRLKVENRVDVLWVPDNTQAKYDRKIVEDKYSRSPAIHQVIITTFPQGGDVLVPEALALGQELHRRVTAVEVRDPSDSEVMWTYDDLCVKEAFGCWQLSVLPAIGFKETALVNHTTNLVRLNGFIDQFGKKLPVRAEDVLGGISRNPYDGKITQAKAASFTYFIKREDEQHKFLEADMILIDRGNLWEEAFLKEMAAFAEEAKLQGYQIDYMSSGAWDRELQTAVNSEAWLLNFAVILILLYTVVMLSRWSEGLVGTRGLLAVAGILSIGMSTAMSIGLCCYLGIMYSALMGLMPFLLLGIGVDNLFVIVNAFDKTCKEDPIEQRLANALGLSGTSISVTSLTNLFAFVIGAQTSLPVLRAFSFYAAFGVFCNYALQVTLFPALLVLDSRRRAAGRYDIFVCWSRQNLVENTPWKFMGLCPSDEVMNTMMLKLGKLLTQRWVKAIVLIAFSGVTGLAAWGTSGMKVDADLNNFVPANSHIHSFDATRAVYFPSVGDQTAVYVDEVSFTDPATWDQMSVLSDAFSSDPFVEDASITSWFKAFQRMVNSTGDVTPLNFHPKLIEWLDKDASAGGGSAFKTDIVFNEDRSRIESCRLRGNHIRVKSSRDHVLAMDSLRLSIKPVEFPAGTNCFVFSDHYLVYEQFKVMGKEALVNVGLALLMVLTVVMLLLMNVRAAIFTWINIALAIMELVGILRFWGYHLDTTLVIFIVVSMGLVVDYSAHMVHAFLHASGTPNERVVATLGRIGPAVANAAISTFIAVLPLAFAKSFVFTLFFRTFFLCVTLGLLHGAILLPVLLSLWPPAAPESETTPPLTDLTSVVITSQDGSTKEGNLDFGLKTTQDSIDSTVLAAIAEPVLHHHGGNSVDND